MDDVRQMRDNCYEYNRMRNPHLLPTIDLLYSTFEERLKAVTINFNYLRFLLFFSI